MGATYAELHVGGHVFVLRRCTYGVSQATGPRGRPIEQVRHGHVEGEMDVPRHRFMEQWAATAYRPLDGYVVFSGGPGEPAIETVSWEAGQCVFYREVFNAGSITTGSYVCQWRIAAAKLVFSAGPPAPFVAPAPREPAPRRHKGSAIRRSSFPRRFRRPPSSLRSKCPWPRAWARRPCGCWAPWSPPPPPLSSC